MQFLKERMNSLIENKCAKGNCYSAHHISVDDVMYGISCLKSDKKDSIPNLRTSHFRHADRKLGVHISLLLHSMVSHGYCPGDFKLTTVVPIPKNQRKSLYSSDNYRGIALSSIIGKIFDYIILKNHSDILSSSDGQFGFKKGHSTMHCSYVVEEVISYYRSRDTPVYCVMLDASKAFDCVQYIKLFDLLLKKGLCPLVARFLANLYTCQIVRIKWGDHLTDSFRVRNGVKQGGVLSPILFNVYIDELLKTLKSTGIGCHIGNIFVGAFAYADDIILLAPRMSSLKHMLKVAEVFSVEYRITFNALKSKFLLFGRGVDRNTQITIDGVILLASGCEIHLGISFGPDADTARINNSINDLYRKTNSLLAQFGHASSDVKYYLFNRFCMPLYGSQVWNLSSSHVERFYVAWRKCVRRILNVPYRTHNNLINLIVGEMKIERTIEKRTLNFYQTLCSSKNSYVNACLKVTANGGMSSLALSLRHIMHRENVLQNIDDDQILIDRALFIHDLIVLRDEGIDRNEICDIIDFLCVV